MRILVLSDTHFEFHKDRGKSFVDYLWDENKHSPPDAVILAGDISSIDMLRASIKMFAEKFSSDILFVIGNHELYGTTPQNALKKACRIEEDIERVYWLEPYPPDTETESTTIRKEDDGSPIDHEVCFIGGTLWFPIPDKTARKDWMNDFQQIYDFEPWVYEQHVLTAKYLLNNISRGDVVVTHHGPSLKSIHPRYEGSPINQFFASDLEWIINSRRPAIWVQGHTHESLDYKIGDTRIVCNPFGYVRESENPNFDPKLIIEV